MESAYNMVSGDAARIRNRNSPSGVGKLNEMGYHLFDDPRHPRSGSGSSNREEKGTSEQNMLQGDWEDQGKIEEEQYNIPQYQLQPVAPPAWLAEYFDSLGR